MKIGFIAPSTDDAKRIAGLQQKLGAMSEPQRARVAHLMSSWGIWRVRDQLALTERAVKRVLGEAVK